LLAVTLLPECPDDFGTEGNLVIVIEAFVEEFDL
jgi:hypothetical protein